MFELTKLAAFIVGITQVFKEVGLPTKYLPLIAVLIGGLLNALLLDSWTVSAIAGGMFVGLASTGLVAFSSDQLERISPMVDEEG